MHGTLLLRGSNVLSFATLENAWEGVFVLNLCIGRSKFPAGNSESNYFLKPSIFRPAVSLHPEVEELSVIYILLYIVDEAGRHDIDFGKEGLNND